MGRTKKHSMRKRSETLEEEVEKHCVCDSMDYTTLMICCDYCSVWFHVECVNVTGTTAKIIKKFACTFCSDKDPKCVTIYKKRAKGGRQNKQRASKSDKKKVEKGGAVDDTKTEDESNNKDAMKAKTVQTKVKREQKPRVTGKIHCVDEAQRRHTSDESTVNVHDNWMPRRNKNIGSRYCSDSCMSSTGKVFCFLKLKEILSQRFNVLFEIAPNSQTENSERVQQIQNQMAEIKLDALEQWEHGLTPQNRWSACHDKLALSESDGFIVQFIGLKGEWRSVRCPIPKGKCGIFYYEVTIVAEQYGIYIELGLKQMPLKKFVGFYKCSYAYDSWGKFWGHEVEGCSNYNGRPYIEGIPENQFGVGDVIGCGVDLATHQIFYTKNGQRLETAGLYVNFGADLFPCVTLTHPGTKIEANFGPNFKFNIAADGI